MVTFLELVNAVFSRLRTDPIDAFSDDVYVQSIMSHINDAKEFVEGAWDWSNNRYVDVIAVQPGDKAARLPNSDRDGYKLSRLMDGNGRDLRRVPRLELAKQAGNYPTGNPDTYAYGGYDEFTGMQLVALSPAPTATVLLTAASTARRPRLKVESDELHLPTQPVVLYATAFASRERGETGGTSTQEWSAFAQQALGDAIARDTTWYPEEFIWREV